MTEWGPWIEHDGKGCPCVGEYAHTVHKHKSGWIDDAFGFAGSKGGDSWDWGNMAYCTRIIRYRIRKPKGLTILEGILENLPQEEPAQ